MSGLVRAVKENVGGWSIPWMTKLRRAKLQGAGVSLEELEDHWDVNSILKDSPPSALNQFPVKSILKGELDERSDIMKERQEWFRYQLGPTLDSGIQTIQLTRWFAVANLMRRTAVVGDLLSLSLMTACAAHNHVEQNLATAALINRDGARQL